ncbi:hypothetical protein FRAHR75_50077 [Frankia sp. Hr75.2]|nr:hypothetical protein FRAHR75_50077 [Frankia sp. Hr75.2]
MIAGDGGVTRPEKSHRPLRPQLWPAHEPDVAQRIPRHRNPPNHPGTVYLITLEFIYRFDDI